MSKTDQTHQALVAIATTLSPAVNSSKMAINTGDKAFRDIKLCDEAYNLVGTRAASVQWFSQSFGYKTITYKQNLSSPNYAIYEDNFFKIVIIAFRGTNNFRDALTDVRIMTGSSFKDSRFIETKNLYPTLRAMYDNTWTFETTGHSLGGSLCLYLNYLYGISVNAFDPAVGKQMFDNNPNAKNAVAHIVKGDPVSPGVFTNPNVVGTLKIYPVENLNYGPYGYHTRGNFYV
jgi:hypothetical protein